MIPTHLGSSAVAQHAGLCDGTSDGVLLAAHTIYLQPLHHLFYQLCRVLTSHCLRACARASCADVQTAVQTAITCGSAGPAPLSTSLPHPTPVVHPTKGSLGSLPPLGARFTYPLRARAHARTARMHLCRTISRKRAFASSPREKISV